MIPISLFDIGMIGMALYTDILAFSKHKIPKNFTIYSSSGVWTTEYRTTGTYSQLNDYINGERIGFIDKKIAPKKKRKEKMQITYEYVDLYGIVAPYANGMAHQFFISINGKGFEDNNK